MELIHIHCERDISNRHPPQRQEGPLQKSKRFSLENLASKQKLSGLLKSKKSVFDSIEFGGASRDRTGDLLVANQALSQLSYGPSLMVGLGGVAPPTSPLSGVRSN